MKRNSMITGTMLIAGMTTGANASLLSVTDNMRQISPPQDLSAGAKDNDTKVFLMQEQSNLILSNDLTVDGIVSGTYTNGSFPVQPSDLTIDLGMTINSYLLHADPRNENSDFTGTITFDATETIVGIIWKKDTLTASDSILGNPANIYTPEPASRMSLEGDDLLDYADSPNGVRSVHLRKIIQRPAGRRACSPPSPATYRDME